MGQIGMPWEQPVYIKNERGRVLGGWFLGKGKRDRILNEMENKK